MDLRISTNKRSKGFFRALGRRFSLLQLPILVLVAQQGLCQEIPRDSSSHVLSHGPSSGSLLTAMPARFLDRMAEHGVTFQYSTVHDLSFNPIESSGDWFARYSLDLSASIDGGKSFHWRGGRALIHLKQHIREFGRAADNVAQGYSNIDGSARTTLYEMWLEQTLFLDRIRIKGGKFDANTEFAVVASASDFLNSSMGYSPTIMAFPTYPEPKLGIDVSVRIANTYQASLGVLETSEKAKMFVNELSRGWIVNPARLEGRGSIGYWYLRGSIDRFDGDTVSGTRGLYGVLEQTLWQKVLAGDGNTTRRLAAFAQYGTGDGRENPYVYHLGAGVIMDAPFQSRPSDGIGFAATSVRFTSEPQCNIDEKAEQVIEGYYKLTLGRHAALTSDIQFFHHLGGVHSTPNYLVATPRLVIAF